jgi:3-dehydroquinate synthase
MVQAKPHPPSLNGNSQQVASSESQQIIQFNHPEKYRTSDWYTGQGEIAASGDSRSFSVSATYTLKAEVKLVDGVFNPDNLTLAEVYSRRGRCVAIVDRTVDELYGESLRRQGYFVLSRQRINSRIFAL